MVSHLLDKPPFWKRSLENCASMWIFGSSMLGWLGIAKLSEIVGASEGQAFLWGMFWRHGVVDDYYGLDSLDGKARTRGRNPNRERGRLTTLCLEYE